MLAILVVLPLLAEDLVAQLFSHPGNRALKVIKQPAIEADQVVRCFVFVSEAHCTLGVLDDDLIEFVSFIHHTYILAEPLLAVKLGVARDARRKTPLLIQDAIDVVTQGANDCEVLLRERLGVVVVVVAHNR